MQARNIAGRDSNEHHHYPPTVEEKPNVESKGSSYARYHRLFRERQNELWRRAKKPERYHATIITTWELAFDEIKKTPGALDLLNLCCFLDPESIPLGLIKQLPAIASPVGARRDAPLRKVVADELALDDALGALRRYSLMKQTDDALTIHRLVQAVARSRMDETLVQNWLGVAIALVLKTWPFQQNKMETWEESKKLLPQLIFVAEFAHAQKFETE